MNKTTLTPTAVSECNTLHTLAQNTAAQARDLAERAAHYAVLLGIRLKEIKDQTPHGGWGKLFGGKFKSGFEFSDQTARNYIRVAEGILAQDTITSRDRKAITTLATTASELDEKDHALLNKATDHGTLSQLYLDLGITPKRPPVIPQQIALGEDNGPVTTPDASKDAEAMFYEPLKKIDRLFKTRTHLALKPTQAETLEDLLRSFIDDLKLIK